MDRSIAVACNVAMLAAVLVHGGGAQSRPPQSGDGDWPMYRRDYAGSGHSPLAQIDTKNVTALSRVWTYGLQNDPATPTPAGRGGGPNSEATPIVVGAVMYLPAAGRVAALQSETGKELWRYTVTGTAPSRRGVAYWAGDATNPPRIVFMAGRRLIELGANSGTPVASFGNG